jgi:hypothetical protein
MAKSQPQIRLEFPVWSENSRYRVRKERVRMYVAGCDVMWTAWIREITCTRGFKHLGPSTPSSNSSSRSGLLQHDSDRYHGAYDLRSSAAHSGVSVKCSRWRTKWCRADQDETAADAAWRGQAMVGPRRSRPCIFRGCRAQHGRSHGLGSSPSPRVLSLAL